MKQSKQTQLQNKIQKLVIMGVMVAIVIVLQAFGGAIAIPGTGLSITLTLVPIVLGAILYGPVFGSVLGLAFGVMVSMSVLQGAAGPLSAAMLSTHPFLTIFLCLFKGWACGFVAGLIGKIVMKKDKKYLYPGAFAAAAICPVVNTAIFCIGLVAFYGDIAKEYAAGTSLLAFIFVAIIGTNFLIELAVNLIAAPVLVRVIRALKKSGILKADTGNV